MPMVADNSVIGLEFVVDILVKRVASGLEKSLVRPPGFKTLGSPVPGESSVHRGPRSVGEPFPRSRLRAQALHTAAVLLIAANGRRDGGPHGTWPEVVVTVVAASVSLELPHDLGIQVRPRMSQEMASHCGSVEVVGKLGMTHDMELGLGVVDLVDRLEALVLHKVLVEVLLGLEVHEDASRFLQGTHIGTVAEEAPAPQREWRSLCHGGRVDQGDGS
mmetsp:Transcript_2962/g.8858  ORF Transcript_2962/g.8858 Transcript_2962/m.8858 type:complete len:218 (-) Transcript_2962:46-699(-)